MVDNTRQYINVFLILLSEPRGKAPLFIDDWSRFKPSSAMEWAAWAAAKIGLVDPIPYQPIGGLKRARGGFVSPDVPAPLGSLTTVRTDYEAHFLMQNLMLTGEALRLGGWVHGAPMIPHVWKRDPATGNLGLGFREYSAKPSTSRFKRWPPVPASQPNYVGIDGVLEGLCPPYVTDMDAAVDQVLEEKFGEGGTYADAEVFAQVYKDSATAETYMQQRRPPAGRGGRVHEGDLPLPGGDLRALPGPHRRLPPPGHLGAVLAPGDRVLRALRQPRPRAPPGRGQGDLGPALMSATRPAPARQRDRPDDGTDAVHARPAAVAAASFGWASSCPGIAKVFNRHILQFNFIKFVRWTVVRDLPGEG